MSYEVEKVLKIKYGRGELMSQLMAPFGHIYITMINVYLGSTNQEFLVDNNSIHNNFSGVCA
jgi:hypothetical protein